MHHLQLSLPLVSSSNSFSRLTLHPSPITHTLLHPSSNTPLFASHYIHTPLPHLPSLSYSVNPHPHPHHHEPPIRNSEHLHPDPFIIHHPTPNVSFSYFLTTHGSLPLPLTSPSSSSPPPFLPPNTLDHSSIRGKGGLTQKGQLTPSHASRPKEKKFTRSFGVMLDCNTTSSTFLRS
jgi:hypothetical protein